MLDYRDRMFTDGLRLSGTREDAIVLYEGQRLMHYDGVWNEVGLNGAYIPVVANNLAYLFALYYQAGAVSFWLSNVDISIDQTILSAAVSIVDFTRGLRINIENRRLVIERRDNTNMAIPSNKLILTEEIANIRHVVLVKKGYSSISDSRAFYPDIYVNGKQRSYTESGNAPPLELRNIENLSIGKLDASDREFTIYDLAIWKEFSLGNRQPLNKEVALMYRKGYGCDIRRLPFSGVCSFYVRFDRASFYQGQFHAKWPVERAGMTYRSLFTKEDFIDANFEAGSVRKFGAWERASYTAVERAESETLKDYVYPDGSGVINRRSLDGVLSDADGNTQLPENLLNLLIDNNDMSGISSVTSSHVRNFFMQGQSGSNSLQWSGQQVDMFDFYCSGANLTFLSIDAPHSIIIKRLTCNNNQLNQTFESLCSALIDLEVLNARNNQLYGEISFAPSARTYYLENNQLSGSLPDFPAGLTTLIITNNSFTQLPDDFADIEVLQANNNKLYGTIKGKKIRDLRCANNASSAGPLEIDFSENNALNAYVSIGTTNNLEAFIFPTTGNITTFNALELGPSHLSHALIFPVNYIVMPVGSTLNIRDMNQNVVFPIGISIFSDWMNIRNNNLSQANMTEIIDNWINNIASFDTSPLKAKHFFLGGTNAPVINDPINTGRVAQLFSFVKLYNWNLSVNLVDGGNTYGFDLWHIVSITMHPLNIDEIVIRTSRTFTTLMSVTVDITETTSFNGSWVIQSMGTDTQGSNGAPNPTYYRIKKSGFDNTGLSYEPGVVHLNKAHLTPL